MNLMLVNNTYLIVYYEIPQGKREEVKQEFDNYTRNYITLFFC
jgi:hypothetical protein